MKTPLRSFCFAYAALCTLSAAMVSNACKSNNPSSNPTTPSAVVIPQGGNTGVGPNTSTQASTSITTPTVTPLPAQPIIAQPASTAVAGGQWCDTYTKECWPVCTNNSAQGDWGYQPELGGKNGSCRSPSSAGITSTAAAATTTPNTAATTSAASQWCDSYTKQCWPVCTNNSAQGEWGYQPALGGLNGSCRSPGSTGVSSSTTPPSTYDANGKRVWQWCDSYTNECWPICTNGSASGDWGYQAELGGRNGSCRAPGSAYSSTLSSGADRGRQWCDSYSKQCWPICTNGSAQGDWGYQPDLGGQNGSCRAPSSANSNSLNNYPQSSGNWCSANSNKGYGCQYRCDKAGDNRIWWCAFSDQAQTQGCVIADGTARNACE